MTTTSAVTASTSWRTPTVVLVCGSLILTLGMGLRHGFGLFLQPVSADMHWHRETFALALAVQNLVWGATQPFAGMLADKYGTGRIVRPGVTAPGARKFNRFRHLPVPQPRFSPLDGWVATCRDQA